MVRSVGWCIRAPSAQDGVLYPRLDQRRVLEFGSEGSHENGILEIHHHAVRIDAEPPKLEAVQKFHHDVLGLDADPGRPRIPGVPGFWINIGQGG